MKNPKIIFIFFCTLLSLVSAFAKHHFGWDFILLVLPLLLLVYCAFEDLREKQIHFVPIVLFVVFSLLYFFTVLGTNLLNLALAVIVCSIIPLFLVLVSREKWMGWGDVLLSFGVGALLGYPNSLVAIFLAFLVGALSGIITLSVNKDAKTLAFGPFLLVGCLLSILVAPQLIAGYYRLMGF